MQICPQRECVFGFWNRHQEIVRIVGVNHARRHDVTAEKTFHASSVLSDTRTTFYQEHRRLQSQPHLSLLSRHYLDSFACRPPRQHMFFSPASREHRQKKRHRRNRDSKTTKKKAETNEANEHRKVYREEKAEKSFQFTFDRSARKIAEL